MPTISPDDLERITTDLLIAAGARDDDARIVAFGLVGANLTGCDSHGVMRLPQYIAKMENGAIVPDAEIEVVREAPATAVIDANWCFGQVAATRATEMAIAKTRAIGLAAVSGRRSNHVGALADYVEMIADSDLIGLMFVNGHGGAHNTVPFGGADRRLCTNPMAAGFPTDSDPIVLDISTAAVAEGKVRTYRIAGRPVPDRWIVDSEGRPTSDPNVLYDNPRGALLPLGGNVGYKGFGLGMMVDMLAGGLSGAGTSGPDAGRGGNAFTIIALDPAAFAGEDAFRADAASLVAWVKSARPAPGFDEVIVPGEIERHERLRREREGIPIPDETWEEIRTAAENVGVRVS
ncbi:MAG: Ldh family oxidoreductase [Armatimonadota bacterium]